MVAKELNLIDRQALAISPGAKATVLRRPYKMGQPLTAVCRQTVDRQRWHVIMDVTTRQP